MVSIHMWCFFLLFLIFLCLGALCIVEGVFILHEIYIINILTKVCLNTRDYSVSNPACYPDA